MAVTADALQRLLRTLQPRRNPGVYAFVRAPDGVGSHTLQPLAVFRESEGTTWIIDAALAEAGARLGKGCTITYHPHLEEQTYFTRVHVGPASHEASRSA